MPDRQRESIFARLGEDRRESVGGEILKLVDVEMKGHAVAGIFAAHQLVAYCGRYLGDELPDDDTPKYVLPKGFRKDIEVFNLHRYLAAPPEIPYAVLFESYFSVFRHDGHIPALSVMGRSISPTQIAKLADAGIARVLIVFDGDAPGRAGARAVAGELAPRVWTRVIDLPEGVKPHHLSWDELRPYLLSAWQGTPLPR